MSVVEIDSIKSRFDLLQSEINILKEKTLDDHSIVKKFSIGCGNLDLILSSQKCSLNKNGLGYRHVDFKTEFSEKFQSKIHE